MLFWVLVIGFAAYRAGLFTFLGMYLQLNDAKLEDKGLTMKSIKKEEKNNENK